ncbi:unnamed protein product [Rhizoctonia solani]|uniref:CCA tRNA nucleotidyltransferase, mitochondrial n=1 Tax=Rhizoctonia solani TaxID=456999 RepID=A0A8H3GHQ1_9AGAM|nr:unnamed protein product [Rhizoctonia solani]
MGTTFAEKLQAYIVSKNLEDKSGGRSGTIATIARNPEQSKHLETARMNVLGHEVDFVNLRSEMYAEDSRIPEIQIGTPLEDALRRDITINALFYNVHTRAVEDLTERGLPDLREGIARTPLAPLQTFQDDPLRVLRCIRFSSRFGFEIAEETGSAMQAQSIQDALVRKIKRERVGEELLKMLKGKSPLLSLTTIEKYGIYDTVFGVPSDVAGKTTGTQRAQSTGIHAASILCSFLDSVPTSLPAPHTELLKQAHEDHGLRQRLIFGAALTPWRDMTYPQKKGYLPVVEHNVKEGLKIGSQNHFIPSVPRLFAAHKRASKPSLDKFEGPSQRALIGLLLRDGDVHNPRTGTHWSTSLLFSMIQDLVDLIDDQNTLDDVQAQQVVQTYNVFVDRVLELDLVKSIEEPPKLNGKEIGAVLGIKPGKEIGIYMDHIGGQNHFIPSVPRLFAAHKRASRPSLDKFEGPSQRALIGLLLRDDDVHKPLAGTYWSASLLFSMVQDLVDLIDDQNTLDDVQAQQVVQTYNAFVDRVLDLDLVKSIEEPPRLNGKEIGALLGIKPGKEIGIYIDHVIRWQLGHPDESLDLCKTWLKELHQSLANGDSGVATPPSKRARSRTSEVFPQLRSCTMFVRFAATGLAALSLLPRVYSRSNWFDQSFYFAWGDSSVPFTVPVTTQCETIKIQWQRGSATGPDPVAPYTLQVLTSNYVVPFYIDAGSALSYDFTVPFAPGTQYQICMYDSKGQTGGCQATYTVIPATGTPSCANMTFPQTLEVDAKSSTGPLSQYGWPSQCTDLSVTPKSGTPPFTLTAAPALHPPVNITSNSMAPINWTIDLSWGSPFFVTLADSAGLMWSFGPLHSGDGPDTCLSSGSTSSIPIGATVGAVVGAFVIGGVLASLLFFFVSRKKHSRRMVGGRPSLGSLDLRESSGGRELRPTPYITSPDARAVYSPLGTREESYSSMNSARPMLRPASRSSLGREPLGLATTGLQVEPFDPATASAAPTITGSTRHGQGASTYRSSSPPASPIEGHGRSDSGRDTRSQVYVVHHDGGRAPVTIMTSDGAEVVELPPGYSSVPESSSRQQAVADSHGRSGKGALGR